jgi:hypothetical protein
VRLERRAELALDGGAHAVEGQRRDRVAQRRERVGQLARQQVESQRGELAQLDVDALQRAEGRDHAPGAALAQRGAARVSRSRRPTAQPLRDSRGGHVERDRERAGQQAGGLGQAGGPPALPRGRARTVRRVVRTGRAA